jgi:hypothetical protein
MNRKAALSKRIAKLNAEKLALPKKKTNRKGGFRRGAGPPWQYARFFIGKENYEKLVQICKLQEFLVNDTTSTPLSLLQEHLAKYLKDLDTTIEALKKAKLEKIVADAKAAAKEREG